MIGQLSFSPFACREKPGCRNLCAPFFAIGRYELLWIQPLTSNMGMGIMSLING